MAKEEDTTLAKLGGLAKVGPGEGGPGRAVRETAVEREIGWREEEEEGRARGAQGECHFQSFLQVD